VAIVIISIQAGVAMHTDQRWLFWSLVIEICDLFVIWDFNFPEIFA
jgi:hypothetical protein